MTSEHFVVLGAARPRTGWLTEVGRWSTSSTLPIEFLRCVSVDEVRARLQSDRRHSAVLLGDDCTGVDRDVLESARDAKCAPIIIASTSVRRDWLSLGAACVLPEPLTPETLLTALRDHAIGIERRTLRPLQSSSESANEYGRLITVIGSGGTGTSTTALGLAGHFTSTQCPFIATATPSVAVVDASLNGDQARLHDLGDVVPGLQELVDLHRMTTPSSEEVRNHFWFAPRHGYDVLPGLRRHQDWTTLRRRATSAALDSIRCSFDLVVADADADLEGEKQTGSIDIEDRNQLARELTITSDLVVLTARAGVAGTSRSLEILRNLVELDIDSRRILLVVLCAPRSTRLRSELTRTLGNLLSEALPERPFPTPVMVPLRRDLEPFLHDGAPLPPSALGSVAAASTHLLTTTEPLSRRTPRHETPIAIVPGHLGRTA
jgi:hypothetical protein